MHSHQTAGAILADQIRRHRERLGMSRHDLAAELARLGRPDLTYAVIVSIETGRSGKRRPVAADELLTFGLALATPPLLLLLPLGSETTVPTVPAADPRDPATVWQWMTGQTTPTLDGPIDGRYVVNPRRLADGETWAAAWARAAYPVSLAPEFTRRCEAARKGRLRAALDPSTQPDYVDRLDELASVIQEMTREGLTLPELPPEVAGDMKRLGLLNQPTNPRGTE
ncbi:multiprotein-bridging factor 1 family protein [Streptomyces goshikiensis]|uniref:helix-turn-helix domain-containing protein n=1 Tax=Streptomyces goshikiensis TaxID=1942 RepID=UPI0036BCB146